MRTERKLINWVGLLGIISLISYALAMMIGAVGTGIAPPQYFGIVERCSVFAATGFNAVLGWYLFRGFGSPDKYKNKGVKK